MRLDHQFRLSKVEYIHALETQARWWEGKLLTFGWYYTHLLLNLPLQRCEKLR